MPVTTKEYDAKVDARNRVTLRNSSYDYYHVCEYDDGRIVLNPRVLTAPFQISQNTLGMIDASMENLRKGKASPAIDLSEFA